MNTIVTTLNAQHATGIVISIINRVLQYILPQ